MKSKRKTPKTLCMIVSILFVTLIFVPNSKNHFLLAGIGISGLFLVIGSLILPAFPRLSRVVLKKPKTDSSIRRVWIPKTLAYILRDWKTGQDELKEFLGEEYKDFNLVIALANGRPCEGRVLLKSFEELRTRAKLPNVVFHSLRHSSTTYKLKLNHGDIKATQGDTGHAQADMITEVYSHILDEDRKINAQKFEAAFYGGVDLRKHNPPAENTTNDTEEPKPAAFDLNALIQQLQNSPELASTLAQLLAQ